MNFWLEKFRTCVAAIVLASFSVGSLAYFVSSSGSNNPLSFSWSYNTGLSVLSGSGVMTVTGFNSSMLTASVTLTNTSSLSSNKLIAFGFGIDPNATAVGFSDSDDGGMVGASVSQGTNLGSGIIVEVCVWAASSCQGDTSNGIAGAGGTDSFAINMAGTWGHSALIESLAFKYHTGSGPHAFTSTMTGPPTSGGGSSGSSGSAPEPGTAALALLGFGLLRAGHALRRKQQRKQPAA